MGQIFWEVAKVAQMVKNLLAMWETWIWGGGGGGAAIVHGVAKSWT